jgi:hypothetical protein
LRNGKGMLKVARECDVGSGTVQRIKQEMKGPFVGVAGGRERTNSALHHLELSREMSALCQKQT